MAARQPKKVSGVTVAKADLKVMRESATELGINPKGNAEELIRRITGHFRDTTTKKKLSDCDVCNGDSSIDFRRCPYCGTTDEPAAEPAAAPVAHTAQVVPIERGKALRGEGDLNKSVEKIQKLKIEAVKSVWALGQEIRKNYETELWKLRSVDGKPVYRNFKQFCTRELGMSHTHAYKLMDVSAAFTEQQIAKIGSTKLGIALSLPEPHRAKLLKQAESGKSKAQLEAEAKRLKAGKKKPKAAKDKVSMAVALGRVTIPLLGRVKVKGEHKPAKRVNDDPWAEEELENNVKQTYRVKVNAKGELVLIVERRRIT